MEFKIRYPDGREFGPYPLEELKRLYGEKAFPPNTEVDAGGEWVSLGGWLVVRKRVEQLQKEEASRPRAAPAPSGPTHSSPLQSSPGSSSPTAGNAGPGQLPAAPRGASLPAKPVLIGAVLFLVVVIAALLLR